MSFFGEESEKPSRSAMKRAAKEVEDLARSLAELPASELARLPADPEIRREIDQARATRSHGARDRQIRHLAAFLRRREEQTGALRDFLQGVDEVHLAEKRNFHRLEALRDRLCDPHRFEGALVEIREAFPGADTAAFGRLARSARESKDRKAYREIFRLLRQESERLE